MTTPSTIESNQGAPQAEEALRLEGVQSGYGRVQVLRDIDLQIASGTVAALLGPNGVGKTTLLRTIAGTLPVTSGSIYLDGSNISTARPEERSRQGLCLVPEGRGVFGGLTVRENLTLQVPRGKARKQALEQALAIFPVLGTRMSQTAGSMSGGQQQMLALARGFTASPQVVLLDEVSMGLAPLVVDEIFEALAVMRQTGVAMLLVEQYVGRALEFADAVHLMDRGRITYSGSAADLDQEAVAQVYLSGESLASP